MCGRHNYIFVKTVIVNVRFNYFSTYYLKKLVERTCTSSVIFMYSYMHFYVRMYAYVKTFLCICRYL
jgi:hypothetical protein